MFYFVVAFSSSRGQAIMLLDLLSCWPGCFWSPVVGLVGARSGGVPACRPACPTAFPAVCAGNHPNVPGPAATGDRTPAGRSPRCTNSRGKGWFLKLLLVRGHAREVLGEPLGVREPLHLGEVAFEIFAPVGPRAGFLLSREKRRDARSPPALFLETLEFRLGGRRLGRRLGRVVLAAALRRLPNLASLRREPGLDVPRFDGARGPFRPRKAAEALRLRGLGGDCKNVATSDRPKLRPEPRRQQTGVVRDRAIRIFGVFLARVVGNHACAGFWTTCVLRFIRTDVSRFCKPKQGVQ